MPVHSENVFSIVPAWFSDRLAGDEIERMLRLALAPSPYHAAPARLFVYVDGAAHVEEPVRRALADACPGAEPGICAENLGKGAGVMAGLRRGLETPGAEWFAVRDADGDHRPEDLPGLLELAEQMAAAHPGRPIVVIGGRARLEPPLTLFRAAYEEILNRCVGEALRFALARRGEVINETWYRQYRREPDLQSGYKVYNRPAAETVLRGFEAAMAGGFDARRLGAEIVPFVALILNGGIAGERMRATYREQPASAYLAVKRAEFYAVKLAWTFRECGVNAANAALLLDNELVCAPLMFDDRGREELLRFRENVLTGGLEGGGAVPPFQSGADMF